jgi:acetyltransferase-like isoleucine patch superfamily enzyme
MKGMFKALANGITLFLALPCYLVFRASTLLLGRERAFQGWAQALSLLPGLPGVYVRRSFYRLALAQCGADAFVNFGTVLVHPAAEIGARVYVGLYCVLGNVTLGDDVLLGSNVSVINGAKQHGIDRLDVPIRDQPGEWPRVSVGPDSWVGDRALVLADVGRHCVIGAGAVVTTPVPDYAVAVGVPARVIRFRHAQPEGRPLPPAVPAVV